MSIVWRDATRADLDTVVSLIRQDSRGLVGQGASRQRLEKAFASLDARDDAFLIVGEQAGRVVATYQLFLIEAVSLSAPRRIQIEDVRVEAESRGQGIGAALMADAEERARKMGATLVQMLSNQSRRDTHAFYEARGYTASHFGFKKWI